MSYFWMIFQKTLSSFVYVLKMGSIEPIKNSLKRRPRAFSMTPGKVWWMWNILDTSQKREKALLHNTDMIGNWNLWWKSQKNGLLNKELFTLKRLNSGNYIALQCNIFFDLLWRQVRSNEGNSGLMSQFSLHETLFLLQCKWLKCETF